MRIYGVPMHAWNLDFFKLCVYDCGRLLRLDDFTVNKERFDYVRVLISTTSLEIIKTGAKVLVDGVLLDFTIIEERGFDLGEDACLGEEELSQTDEEFQQHDVHNDTAASGDVDVLLNHLSEEWQKEDSANTVRPSVGLHVQETTQEVPKAATTLAALLKVASSLVEQISTSVNIEKQCEGSCRSKCLI